MAIMIVSKPFASSLNSFAFGYARLEFRKQRKQVFSLFPYAIILTLIILIAVLVLQQLKKRKNKQEVELENFLTRRNEGILLTKEEWPGLLTGKKEDLAKLLQIALDKQIIERGETPNHVFFLLSKDDKDVFSREVLEILGDKHVWIFLEQVRNKTNLGRIGKTIIFDPEHMETCGNPLVVLGIVPRFLSMISRQGETNLDHVYSMLPDRSTLSYSFPADVHASLASLLKHQKFFSMNHGEDILQITNVKDFAQGNGSPIKYVEADTEPFFITFKEEAT